MTNINSEKANRDASDWLNNFADGAIVHLAANPLTVRDSSRVSYRTSKKNIGCWYRCRMETNTDGNKQLRGVNLVGPWEDDLIKRWALSGDLEIPMGMRWVIYHEVFTPGSRSRVFEIADAHRRDDVIDPNTLAIFTPHVEPMGEDEAIFIWRSQIAAYISEILKTKVVGITSSYHALEVIEKLTQMRDDPFPKGQPTLEKPCYGSLVQIAIEELANK